MAVDLDTEILAPLVVLFAGATLLASAKVYFLSQEKKALKRDVADLNKKLRASEEHRKEHLSVATDRYREEIDREKEKFKEAKMSHEETRAFAASLLRFIERKHPGWLRDRMDGKPEYEFVFSTPRPTPPPKNPKGAVPPSNKEQ